MFKANINITLKKSISDPAGIAVQNSLQNLGFDTVEKVRIGKYIEVYINETEIEIVKNKIDEMCRKLLTNPIMEEYSFEILEVSK
ncbi:phosphoribosylformylglycinamidine synthase subunit PurS [Caldicellulosiruptoraceae bacterium PP1]